MAIYSQRDRRAGLSACSSVLDLAPTTPVPSIYTLPQPIGCISERPMCLVLASDHGKFPSKVVVPTDCKNFAPFWVITQSVMPFNTDWAAYHRYIYCAKFYVSSVCILALECLIYKHLLSMALCVKCVLLLWLKKTGFTQVNLSELVQYFFFLKKCV